jgi:CBS domain-containing protein
LAPALKVQELLDDKALAGARLHSVAPGASVRDAVRLMAGNNISSALVMEDGRMAGLITLRELLRGLDMMGERLLDACAEEVMVRKPVCIAPGDSVDALRSLMTEFHVTHVPVCAGDDLLGIISFHDIARGAIKDAMFENDLLKKYIKNWPE